jgi:outer membrane biosynthesis protein TonB
MPWFHEFLTSISRARARSRPRLGIRVLAASLSVVLVFGSIAPGVAFAGEADSEQEGSAPPGALPGLEEGPGLESGEEETALEELPGTVGAGEEAEEGPPLETEPAQEAEPAPAPPEEPATVPPVVSEEPASVPAPGPEYETATEPPPAAPVENEALTAPESSPPAQQTQAAPEAAQPSPETPPPASPPEEAPPPEGGQPPAVPVQRDSSPGSLAGHRVHVVRAGECLWSIAEALLPADANTAEIAAEVQRLWRLNASRIGTGDPSLVYAGTKLRLR